MNGFGRHHQPTQGCSECDAFEASVLLRDSPEDRERLIRAYEKVNGNAIDGWFRIWREQEIDAIIAALRGEA